MKTSKILLLTSGALAGFLLAVVLLTLGIQEKKPRVHTLKTPLILLSNVPSTNLHLLPIGTTLYFDQSFPEGFTRYKIYMNIDRMPLALRDLADASEVDPIEARALTQFDLAKAVRDYPLTRQELEAILHSKHLPRQEIVEVFSTYLKNTK
jgi:hypothetical protein